MSNKLVLTTNSTGLVMFTDYRKVKGRLERDNNTQQQKKRKEEKKKTTRYGGETHRLVSLFVMLKVWGDNRGVCRKRVTGRPLCIKTG